MIRFMCIATFLGLYLILGIPALLVEGLLAKFNRKSADISSLRLVQWAFKCMLKMASVQVTVIGEELIPDEPVLFVGNHRSYFDILLTYSRCKRLTGYIAKKEMLRIPLLRDWMHRLHCLFLDRSTPKEGLKTILAAIDYIKQGISICIFPEGTRNDGEELSMIPFHEGSFKIAEKTGCPIVPMCLNNTAAIFENQFPKIRKVHVVLEYKEPIYPNELDKEAKKRLASHCQSLIQETINKNQALI